MLRISLCKGHPQYYYRKDQTDICGRYIKKCDRNLAAQLANKDYNQRILEEVEAEIKAIDIFLATYTDNAIMQIYSDLNFNRKSLITPYEMSDFEYAAKWLSAEYEHKAFSENSPEYYNLKNLRMRSKSETLISDMLDYYRVPYRYEYPIVMNDGTVYHPDFYTLNVRLRKEFVWEHCGRIDESDYRNDMMERIENYSASGYTPNDNLILSYETYRKPLNTRIVKNIIQTKLL